MVLKRAALCGIDGTKKTKVQRRRAYEVFCGKAELTKQLRNAGFNAIGIDYKGNKDKSVAQVLILDVNTDWGRQEVQRIILRGRCCSAHVRAGVWHCCQVQGN